MKLPLYWLKKYIDVKISAEKLAELLTLSGTAVERVEKKNGEDVLEIEVTTNRPDCLSILGLAREVSALTGKKVTMPKALSSPKSLVGDHPRKGAVPFFIVVEDKKGCPLYTGQLIQNVSVSHAPEEVRKCLELCGARPISNVVDATNFVLFECGQPLHAFDFDKIKGGQITVRRSKKGEKFLSLEGAELMLDEKTLVIADTEGPIALAGVMGGRRTEVTETTKNILLESAYFDPRLVREVSKKYKISTESSYRFERGVNPENVAPASRRAASLIMDWAGGNQSGGLAEKNYLKKVKASKILLRTSRIQKLLGVRLSQNRAVSILKSLDFETKAEGLERIWVTQKISRKDIAQEADLIEEILRIEGFGKIPMSLPSTHHNFDSPHGEKEKNLAEIKKFLAAIGFHEISTYSLLSEKALRNSNIAPPDCHRITNAVSAEQEYFRPSLLPGMMETLVYNIFRKAASLKFFEIGNRCRTGEESTMLSLALYGNAEENWRRKSQASYFDLKGILESLFHCLNVENHRWKAGENFPWFDESGGAFVGEEAVAHLGRISASVLKKWDISHDVFFAEVCLDSLLKVRRSGVELQAIGRFPSARRDIAFILDEKIEVAALEDFMKNHAEPFLKEVTLFDQYKGKGVAAGKRSLAFSLAYQKNTGTFTDEEIVSLQTRLGDALKQAYGVEFR